MCDWNKPKLGNRVVHFVGVIAGLFVFWHSNIEFRIALLSLLCCHFCIMYIVMVCAALVSFYNLKILQFENRLCCYFCADLSYRINIVVAYDANERRCCQPKYASASRQQLCTHNRLTNALPKPILSLTNTTWTHDSHHRRVLSPFIIYLRLI